MNIIRHLSMLFLLKQEKFEQLMEYFLEKIDRHKDP